jgi:hypothetical protein
VEWLLMAFDLDIKNNLTTSTHLKTIKSFFLPLTGEE